MWWHQRRRNPTAQLIEHIEQHATVLPPMTCQGVWVFLLLFFFLSLAWVKGLFFSSSSGEGVLVRWNSTIKWELAQWRRVGTSPPLPGSHQNTIRWMIWAHFGNPNICPHARVDGKREWKGFYMRSGLALGGSSRTHFKKCLKTNEESFSHETIKTDGCQSLAHTDRIFNSLKLLPYKVQTSPFKCQIEI